MNFRKQVPPKHSQKKQQKQDVLKNLEKVEGREKVINGFECKLKLKLKVKVFKARYLTTLISKYWLLSKCLKDYQ